MPLNIFVAEGVNIRAFEKRVVAAFSLWNSEYRWGEPPSQNVLPWQLNSKYEKSRRTLGTQIHIRTA